MARGSTFRRLVAERGLIGALATSLAYLRWRLRGSAVETAPNLDRWLAAYRDVMPESVGDTSFSIICPVFNTRPDLLKECVKSVFSQRYEHWELILVDDGSTNPETLVQLKRLAGRRRVRVLTMEQNVGIAAATNAGIAASTGEYLVFLDHDDLLAPTALAWLSTCTPSADLVYSDEGQLDPEGRHRVAVFKPSWSPRLLLGVNYVNHVTCVRAELVREIGGLREGLDGVQDHDLLLRLSELPIEVAHIPNILYHWRIWSGALHSDTAGKLRVEALGIRMIDEAIARRGWNARAGLGNGSPFNYRVYFEPEPQPPSVKIVMPTRDRVMLLRRAAHGVLARTDGVRTHLVIVDNGSTTPEALEYIEHLSGRDDVSIHRVDDAFNFSRLCNEGVDVGPETDMVLLLNNDVEVVHRRWLLQLTGWLRDPAVGAVGPKLRFRDGTIQHAGVIIGFGGIAGHYSGYQMDQPRAGNLHDQAREVGGLTAACLLVRSDDYKRIGGMNEDLPLDFQDVDFCLRMRRDLGAALVYDPTYPLIHLQSASRGKVGASSEYTAERMVMLWGPELSRPDPFYSPHMTTTRHNLAPAGIPSAEAERRARLEPRFSSHNG